MYTDYTIINTDSIYMWYPTEIKDILRSKLELESLKTDLHLPKFLYIIHLLYHSKFLSPVYQEKGKVINQAKLANDILGVQVGIASKMLQLLIKWGYIRRVGGYTPGVNSYPYKLTKKLEALRAVRHIHTAEKPKSFIYHVIKNEHRELSTIEKYQLEIFRNSISLSWKGLDYIGGKYPESISAISYYSNSTAGDNYTINYSYSDIAPEDIGLLAILYQEYYTHRAETGGRVYSNIANLSSEHRPYIFMDGKPIMQTDITNSQLLFGAFAIEEHCKETGQTHLLKESDILRFRKACESGTVYNLIAEAGGTKQLDCLIEDRKKFKQRFFKMVWFSDVYTRDKNRKRTAKRKDFDTGLAKAFKSLFPTVLTLINQMKEEDAAGFAVKLQNLEAEMMLDIIGSELMERGVKFLTIHDSFVVNNPEDLDSVENLIREAFWNKYRCVPHFKSGGA